MNRFVYFLLLPCVMALCTSCHISQPTQAKEKQTINKIFNESASQYGLLMENIPPGKFPKNYDPAKNSYEWSGSEWWCSGFYPGTLLKLYKETGQKQLLAEAERMLTLLEKEQFNKGTHDLGFMMFCSFGMANQVNPQIKYKEILLNSARSLASRFNPAVGCIRSWDSDSTDFLVIIDNMMNLELLFWATRESGDSSFYHIATTHAHTTIKNHFRNDNSSYHVINYDPITGNIKEKRTAQGYNNESAWARGQAWGLYGFTMTYRETKDPVYLEQAQKIAEFILNHPNLPKDKVPYWDFHAPQPALRDASAAAIMASALLELDKYLPGKNYFGSAETILQSLSTQEYRATPGSNGGFILKHGVGHLPQKTEVDVALTYADYYYVEALGKYEVRGTKYEGDHSP